MKKSKTSGSRGLHRGTTTHNKQLKNLDIKLLILDVDGVLTNGQVYMCACGSESKGFSTQDGIGLKLLLANGIEIAVISGRKSPATKKRLRELNIKHVYLGVADKVKVFAKLKTKLSIENNNIAYIGDDLPDLLVMQQVGFSIAVDNAVDAIKNIAHHITARKGGDGAVREVCDFILNAK